MTIVVYLCLVILAFSLLHSILHLAKYLSGKAFRLICYLFPGWWQTRLGKLLYVSLFGRIRKNYVR